MNVARGGVFYEHRLQSRSGNDGPDRAARVGGPRPSPANRTRAERARQARVEPAASRVERGDHALAGAVAVVGRNEPRRYEEREGKREGDSQSSAGRPGSIPGVL